MRKTMAPTRSVHFIDSETISKQIFAPTRYNLPLFLCKKLNVHSAPLKNSTKQQWTSDHDRMALLQRMAKYHINDLTKDSTSRKEKSFKISQPQSGALAVHPRRRCNAHRAEWPRCPRPLRDGRKEWSLPPGRYRLGGSIADLANRSTGARGRDGHPTKGKPSRHETCTGTKRNKSSGHLDTISAISLPAEMNKLLHRSKYFVGKIRPGDRMNERPTTRLAISELTVCRRDPNDPGPGQYDPEPQSRSQQPTGPRKMSRSAASCCYTYDQYCCEPFFRPPPGRYDIRAAPLPLSTGKVRHRGEQIHIPIQSTTSKPHPDGDARGRPPPPPPPPPSSSVRRKVTLRLNSINIPVRPRKGRRNMKVAFMSGSARFRDRDFFPIGGLGKATTASSSKRHLQWQQQTTSKKLHDTADCAQAEEPSGSATRTALPVEQSERDENEEQHPEKEGEDCVQFLTAHGICSQGTLPLSRPGNKMSTRFFTVPKLTRNRQWDELDGCDGTITPD
ncbi:uncharacterized protein LOC128309454 [Anopheles moucheti]|uniref:uncharacterized protein LOC128309454 n=1 Tax=Anopheles moucheti TaxID=186751 RepID=UPI0022F03A7D|nr:uncharacterized protein LOC128309454 [Anopheles moucheti]